MILFDLQFFFRCVAFKKAYTSLCPIMWVRSNNLLCNSVVVIHPFVISCDCHNDPNCSRHFASHRSLSSRALYCMPFISAISHYDICQFHHIFLILSVSSWSDLVWSFRFFNFFAGRKMEWAEDCRYLSGAFVIIVLKKCLANQVQFMLLVSYVFCLI